MFLYFSLEWHYHLGGLFGTIYYRGTYTFLLTMPLTGIYPTEQHKLKVASLPTGSHTSSIAEWAITPPFDFHFLQFCWHADNSHVMCFLLPCFALVSVNLLYSLTHFGKCAEAMEINKYVQSTIFYKIYTSLNF